MALKKTVTTEHGIEVVGAYHRVENVVILTKSEMSYHIRVCKDASGLPFFCEQVLTSGYDIDGANPIAQAYKHLKSLPEFADAEDC